MLTFKEIKEAANEGIQELVADVKANPVAYVINGVIIFGWSFVMTRYCYHLGLEDGVKTTLKYAKNPFSPRATGDISIRKISMDGKQGIEIIARHLAKNEKITKAVGLRYSADDVLLIAQDIVCQVSDIMGKTVEIEAHPCAHITHKV